jgi:uncharacterized protein YhaN
MRIDSLSLLAFGPFTDKVLDFSGRPGALQLVYGPNEAGKSSTLRALLGLLYGIPVRTGDAHTHDQTKLRIAATLVDEAGRMQHVVRRKGAKNTLSDAEGNVLAESVVSGLLGGLDEGLFSQMFGLDHVRLREGAEALLRGGGQLGEVLFDASMGGRGIHTLIESLRAEADAIFKQRGRTPELNAALDSLKEKKKRRTDAMLSPQAFVDQQEALAQARRERDAVVELRRGLAAEKSRLSRLLSLLPVLARRDQLVAQLDALPGHAADSEHATDSEHGPRTRVLSSESTAQEDAALEQAVRELNRRYGSVLAAAREEPEKLAELQSLERAVAELRAKLGSGVQGLLGLETATRARLRKRVETERELLRERAELMRSDAADAEEEARLRGCLRELGERPQHDLAALLSEIERDDLPAQLGRSEAELGKLRTQLSRQAAQLELSIDLEQLIELALPSDAMLAEYESALEQSAREQARLSQEREEKRSELARLERVRGELVAFGEPATRVELELARAARDRAFDALFAQGAVHEPGEQALRVRACTAATQHADALADRMCREAQQAAELRRIDQGLVQLRAALDELAARTQREGDQASQLQADFCALIAPLGLGTCTPRSARPLLVQLVALRAQLGQRELLELEAARLIARAHERGTQLLERLAPGSVNVADDAGRSLPSSKRGGPLAGSVSPACAASATSAARSELEGLLRAAREQLARELERTRELAQLRAQLDKVLAARVRHGARMAVVERDLSASHGAYASELSALGLQTALAPDELVACFDELTLLSQRIREVEVLRARLESTRREREALERDVHQLGSRFFSFDAPLTLERALAELSRVQRERSEAKRDQVRLGDELRKLDEQLVTLGDGASLGALRAQVQALEPHQARARVEEIEVALEEQGQRASDLEQNIGRLSAGLERLEQVSGAVELAEDYEHELSRARALTRRYIELKLALSLLSGEVERYRAQHQQPVLKRASELFPRLTLQRYRGLSVEYDEQDEPVLSCLLHGGRSIRVGGLSDGTRDQLYLALRIASIERYFEGRPPLPLILDDALIHFDDVRAAAALEVLGELTQHTQVLFFTHHARMVDLARTALGEHRVQVHELQGQATPRFHGPLFESFAG